VEAIPKTRYAQNDGVNLAYQVVGSGDLDLLLVDTLVHHVEAIWDVPDAARFLRRLGAFGRLIHFDRRGTGLSDPVPLDRLPDLATQVGDAIAVLDAAGSERAVVIGVNDGTIIASLLAIEHPERCHSLVLWTLTSAHDMPETLQMASVDEVVAMIQADAENDRSGVDLLAPSRAGDAKFDEDLSRLQRFSIRVGAFAHYYRQTMEADLTTVLPSIRCPTLVLNRTGNRIVPVEQTRDAAALIENAKFVELPGTDHIVFSEGMDALAEEIEEFITGSRTAVDPDRMLTTLLFTDIVASTDQAAAIGDRRWRDLLNMHNDLTRRELARFGGREVSTTGDGFFAVFDRPVSGVRCALSLVSSMPALGLQVRTGVHTGEVEVRGSDFGGMAVHIASRIAGLAEPGEVLVSSTVKDLLVGSDLAFDDRGAHALKGVAGEWHVYGASTGVTEPA
jgi:class 3 adenylate cyclase